MRSRHDNGARLGCGVMPLGNVLSCCVQRKDTTLKLQKIDRHGIAQRRRGAKSVADLTEPRRTPTTGGAGMSDSVG
jgi:hypothetical protein